MTTTFGASLIARPEPVPTFYVDESIFSNALVAELTATGIDQRIRYRALEKQALIDHGVACFTFTQGQATATQCAARIVALAPKMMAIAASESRPFLYTFGLAAGLSRVTLRYRR